MSLYEYKEPTKTDEEPRADMHLRGKRKHHSSEVQSNLRQMHTQAKFSNR
jgi:hypothetical protein